MKYGSFVLVRNHNLKTCSRTPAIDQCQNPTGSGGC